MKKSILFILVTVLVLTLFSCKEKETFSYAENMTGITVTAYSGTDGELTVPDEIDGKKVTALENGVFEGCLPLKSIALPDTITEIPDNCFKNCENLETVTAPAVTKVGLSAFEGTKLIKADGFVTVGDGILIKYNGTGTNLSVPDTVKDIGTVFFGNTTLKSIFLPDTVTKLETDAFSACSELCDISLPTTIKSIGPFAFYGCYKLEYVDIPAGCLSIGEYAFADCVSLKSISIPDSVTEIGDNILLDSKNAVVSTPFESTAFTYAAENNIPIE